MKDYQQSYDLWPWTKTKFFDNLKETADILNEIIVLLIEENELIGFPPANVRQKKAEKNRKSLKVNKLRFFKLKFHLVCIKSQTTRHLNSA